MNDLVAIRTRVDAATPPPWQTDGPFWVDPPGVQPTEMTAQTRSGVTAGPERKLVAPGEWDTQDADMTFIAHARTDVPALCDEVETLRAALADVREWVQWRSENPTKVAVLLAIIDRAGVTP